MKIAQTECDTIQFGIATGATPIESTTPPIETPITTPKEIRTAESAAERVVVEKLLKYNENACNDNGAVTTTMTDEHNNIVVTTTNSITGNNTNNNNSIINKNVTTTTTTSTTTKSKTSTTAPTTATTTKTIESHKKDNIIAEATKILIKNGLNGTTAVAAAASLLTVAATFQLPPPRPVATPDSRSSSAALSFPISQSSPPPAHSGSSHKIASSLASAPPSGAIDVNAHSRHSRLPHRKFLNNGTSPAAPATAPAKPMAATTTPSTIAQMRLGMSAPATGPHLGGGGATTSSSGKADLSGAIDYTFHAATSSTLFGANHNHHNKYPLGGSSNSRSDLGRNPLSGCTSAGTGAGGRLQFFKDGKFILELARSKDGEGKGGWISVPRKLFRTPSAATSSTVTPTLATTTAYPKNESSTSLSFSDDNSSIQSSPWQRDHCWKQSVPRRGISKEMSLYFWRPRAVVSLTAKGLAVANRKRRKPLDPAEKCESVHFECLRHTHTQEVQDACKEKNDRDKHDASMADESTPLTKQEVTESVQSPKMAAENEPLESMDISGGDTEDLKTSEAQPNSIATTTEKSENVSNAEQQDKRAREVEQQEIAVTQDASKNATTQIDDVVEKMNTSEDGGANGNGKTDVLSECGEDGAANANVNGNDSDGRRSENDAPEINVCETEKATESAGDHVQQNDGTAVAVETVSSKAMTSTETPKEGHSKTILGKCNKPRAKLNTIIQKLIDSMPTRIVPLSKASTLATTNTTIGNSNNNNNTNNKVSPTSSSTAVGTSARLVDYHQQHVSPRKRILRDLEKVSLEDNGNSVAGGKRSRAKGNSVPIPTTMSSPRAHSITTSTGSSTTAQSSTTLANGNHSAFHPQQQQQQQQEQKSSYHQHSTTEVAKLKKPDLSVATATSVASSSSSSICTVPAPTRQRLYSSYSIHSLLGGGSGSSSGSPSSSSPSSSSTSKRPTDQAIVSSASYTHQPQYTDPSYLRNMLASPKSPDSHHNHHNPPTNSSSTTNNNPVNYGGKSPSSSASRKQRSPPYASPMHEGNSRSPAASHADYGRRSPRATPPEGSYKMRYTPEQSASGVNHSHQLGPQHASFYSQYLLSPKYQGSSAAVMSPNSTRSTNHGHATSANTPPSFNSSNNTPFSSTTQHIPNSTAPLYASASSAMTGKALGGSLSPPRSLTASPRDTTPRTVPKKTASIRRQFASPTASSTTSSSCPSPSNEHRSHLEDSSAALMSTANAHQHDRKTPVVTSAPQPTHSLLQRSSPLGSVSPMLHHHYYMYPPVANSAAATHPHASVSNAAAYIPTVMPSVGGLPPAPTLHSAPSYYNPYISTIAALQRNQMWMQYPGGILPVLPPHHSAAAASRLPPQYHGFSYNGSAAMAAAAAAAVAFGGGAPQQLHAPAAVSMYASGGGHSERPRTPKLTDTTDLSTKVSGPTRPATSRSMATESTPILNNCIKDEQSSDVPLNLSKH